MYGTQDCVDADEAGEVEGGLRGVVVVDGKMQESAHYFFYGGFSIFA